MSRVGIDRSSFRVLVVDAEDATCMLLDRTLGDEGFDVMCVSSDAAAYQALNDEAATLDALVIDSNLGAGTTGFDVARHARRLKPNLPVVFISASPREWVEKFGVPGAAHVAKPFDPDIIVMILRELEEER